jgi:hypothetical protein
MEVIRKKMKKIARLISVAAVAMALIKKMKKIARLISVAAVAMALIIAFSGVASASSLAEYYRMEMTDAADKIDVGGLKEGSMAKGTVSAGVSVFVVDGSDGGVGTILSYEEKFTASGLFVFHMVIDYTSVITPP